jgi:hypothetical protein
LFALRSRNNIHFLYFGFVSAQNGKICIDCGGLKFKGRGGESAQHAWGLNHDILPLWSGAARLAVWARAEYLLC